MADLTPKDFSSLDIYNLYLGIKDAIQNGQSSGTPKQAMLVEFAGSGDPLELIDKTKISINVLTGQIALSQYDLEGILLDTLIITENDSVKNFEAFGNPLNKFVIQADLLTDTCEVIYTNK